MSVLKPFFSAVGTVSIGGAHIKEAKPLPKIFLKFLDESTDGAIYFSLGTVVQSSKLPKEKIQAFIGKYKCFSYYTHDQFML